MKIGGVDISAYGLNLTEVSGIYDVPARKKILTVPGFEAKDIRFTDRKISVKLFGKYQNVYDLVAKMEALKVKLLEGFLTFDFTEHGVTVQGYCNGGAEITISYLKVECKMNIEVPQ